ncbi:hypothetical protein EXIGLDRAFT_780389 [Exidia glandulosa HHB12029]|uniref:Uncharacterized protein n=1 Tax=Exidia glandulosa HHB12029 TaxID=1314781 RepID=A0A165BM66_EXIGL|nr:hypothetical protein EXIGLDRAFT_780389 [Exidia glandulosa HHB12029]
MRPLTSYTLVATEDMEATPLTVSEELLVDDFDKEPGHSTVSSVDSHIKRRRVRMLSVALSILAVILVLIIVDVVRLPLPRAASPMPCGELVSGSTAAVYTGTNECSCVVLRRFDEPNNGFGSEYNVYLHAKALENDMRWTVVRDTREWIYGDLDDIFVPPTYNCSLPSDIFDVNARRPVPPWREFGDPGWRQATRLVITRKMDHIREMVKLVREHGVERDPMDELVRKMKLWTLDAEHITLPYGESVPRGEEKAFRAQAAVIAKEWVPTERMQAQIDRLRARVGLEDVDSRSRRPVVVLQIRLGDKRTEAGDIRLAGSHMRQDDLAVYFHAAQLALARLYSPHLTSRPFLPNTGLRPLLIVMTAESGIVEKLVELDTQQEFEIVLRPSEDFSPDELSEYNRVLRPNTTSTTSSLQRRWLQQDFLKASPALRQALTRQLVAELIVYSKYADAFVVSGNSNMGRLALLIAGEEGAMGPPGHRATGGRVRSIDVPWYPGMWFESPFASDQWT